MAGLFGPRKMPSASPIQQLRLQTSTAGRAIPLCYGKTRVTGNLIWYGDFVATPHEHTSGGKGGGITTTDYTYNVSMLMGICEGQINQITKVWRQKEVFSGSIQLGQTPVANTHTVTLPDDKTAATFPVTVPNGATLLSVDSVTYYAPYTVGDNGLNPEITLTGGGVDYQYQGAGLFTFNPASTSGLSVHIKYTYGVGGWTADAAGQIGMGVAIGTPNQGPFGFMTTRHAVANEDLSYHNLCYIGADAYDLGNTPDLRNHSFEVDTVFGYSSTIRDAHPMTIIIDLLSNPNTGIGFPADRLGYWDSFYRYCIASSLFLSPAYIEQKAVRELIDGIMKVTNSGIYQSEGLLKITPLQDTAVSANGVTWTPDLTPVYDLTDDQFLGTGSEDPVKLTRKPNSDAYNHVRVKYYNRDGDYNETVAEAKDPANISDHGLRSMPVIDCPEICNPLTAQIVAQTILQKVLYIRNQYEFRLDIRFSLLEPTDLVTITDENLGLVKMPCRIVAIEEDFEGNLSIKADEFPLNVTTPAIYDIHASFGYNVNYNSTPGNAANPIIFEPPVELVTANSGLEVWVAVGSNAPNYGGCEVWASVDDSEYRRVGRIDGSSRYGFTTTSMPGLVTDGLQVGTVDVSLVGGGQLLSGVGIDAEVGNTLCYIGGEFITYTTSTLIGTAAYRLDGIHRGWDSSGQPAHSANEDFVRIDSQLVKMELDAGYLGKTLFIKVTSFNIYGVAEQSLADVIPKTYAVTGRFLTLPPPNVSSFLVEVKPDGGRKYSWSGNAPKDVQFGGGYQIRYRAAGSGTSFPLMNKLHDGNLTQSPYETAAPIAGTYDFAIVMVDKLGNMSTSALMVLNAKIGNEPVTYGASANLLANSDWVISTGIDSAPDNASLFKWLTFSTMTAASTYYRHYPPATWLMATNGGCTLVTSGDAGSAKMAQVYQFFSVNPGSEYEASVYVGTDNSEVRMQLEWYDLNFNFLGATTYDSCNPVTDITDSRNLGTMKRLWKKGFTPAGCNVAAMVIKKIAAANGVLSGSTFNRAFAGLARPGVQRETATPWIEAGIDSFHGGGIAPLTVGTSQLANNAATEVIAVAGQYTMAFNNTNYEVISEITFTALSSAKLSLIATGDTFANDTNPTANPVLVIESRCHFNWRPTDIGTPFSTADLTFSNVNSYGVWRGQYAVTATIDVVAGKTYVLQFVGNARSTRYTMVVNYTFKAEAVKK